MSRASSLRASGVPMNRNCDDDGLFICPHSAETVSTATYDTVTPEGLPDLPRAVAPQLRGHIRSTAARASPSCDCPRDQVARPEGHSRAPRCAFDRGRGRLMMPTRVLPNLLRKQDVRQGAPLRPPKAGPQTVLMY